MDARFSGDDSAPNGGKAAGSVTVSQGNVYPEPDVSQSSILPMGHGSEQEGER